MAAKRKVVSSRNLPTSLPALSTVVAYLVLDRFHAPEWIWTETIVLFLIWWIMCIRFIYHEDKTELWKKEKEEE